MLIDTKLRLSKMMWMVVLSECLKNESNLYLRFPPSSFSFNGIAIWVFISNVSLCHMYSSEFSIYESFITSCLLTTLRDLSLLCLLENENDLVHLRWTLNCDRQGVRCHQPWAVSVSEKRWCVCVCVHARVRVFCVIISALLPFRGQKYFFFLYYKGTQNHCLLWIVTYFFIQIYQIEIINLSTFYAYFTLPNSLLPYSLFTFIHLYKILHCGHTFTISIAGGFSNACLHLTFCWERARGAWKQILFFLQEASIWIFSPLLFYQLPALFHSTASPKFIFEDALNITQILPELIITVHGFRYMT